MKMKVGDMVKLHKSTRRNGLYAGLTGLLVGEHHQHASHQVLLETGKLVSLHITQIVEVISESR